MHRANAPRTAPHKRNAGRVVERGIACVRRAKCMPNDISSSCSLGSATGRLAESQPVDQSTASRLQDRYREMIAHDRLFTKSCFSLLTYLHMPQVIETRRLKHEARYTSGSTILACTQASGASSGRTYPTAADPAALEHANAALSTRNVADRGASFDQPSPEVLCRAHRAPMGRSSVSCQ
jgi:hypothetical protein